MGKKAKRKDRDMISSSLCVLSRPSSSYLGYLCHIPDKCRAVSPLSLRGC